MTSERQLGLLWGGVSLLLVALSPLAPRLAEGLLPCPVQTFVGLPCPTCGTTRAALALSRFDVTAALSASPLATVSWIGLVVGGIVAGLLALANSPLREPEWITALPVRWVLLAIIAANWLYLLGAAG